MPSRDLDQQFGQYAADDFVGREQELDALAMLLLRRTRLVTLLGPGGIGKTRLAVRASQRLKRVRPTSVYFARLARLPADSDAAAVEEEITRSVVSADYSGRSMWEALNTTLTRPDGNGRPIRTVLIVDNCEHVLAGAGTMVARMLDAMPSLCVLATSREAIGWIDEYRFTVPPLAPGPSLELFRSRAEMAGHPITGDEQLAVAAQICRKMDYHPLYIRLAAGRLVHQPLTTILRQLGGDSGSDHRLAWPAGPALGGEERHRSIGEVINWSYRLCQEKERLLFDRMSVFAGGYDTDSSIPGAGPFNVGADLDAIRAICTDPQTLTSDEIEPLLERLADQSLVTRHLTPTTVRYSLSENLRAYAQQRLSERSECVAGAASLTERHCVYYHNKVLHAAANYSSPAERDLMEWAFASWNNIIAAIERSLAPGGNATRGLEICVGLLVLRLPFFKGSLREMRMWTERALEATRLQATQPPQAQLTAQSLLVWIILCQGEIEDAERILDECVRSCLSDPHQDWRRASPKDLGLPATVDFAWGVELMLVRKDALAVTVLEHACEKFDLVGDTSAAMPSQQFAALAATLLGSTERGQDLAQRYLARTTAAGVSWTRSWAQLTWSIALTRLGKPHEALAVQRAVLTDLLPTHEQWATLWAVEFRAWTLARLITDATGHRQVDRRTAAAVATEIAILTSGTRRLRERLGIDIKQLGPFDDIATEATRVAENTLGPEAFAAAEAWGAELRPELNEVQQLAMGTLATVPSGPRNRPEDLRLRWSTLTTAEQEVAALAAAGWTNVEISVRRGRSRRTVDAQVATILQKLQITSRADIAQFVPREHDESKDLLPSDATTSFEWSAPDGLSKRW